MKKLGKIVRRLLGVLVIVAVVVLGIITYRTYQTINQVEKFRATVKTYYPNDQKSVQLVLAIIMTESKGLGTDIMQSLESTGQTEALDDSVQASIANGIVHLKSVQALAAEKKLDIWSGVQAYNFGSDYLNYLVKENKTATTKKLAETYSRDVLAPLLGNTTQEKYSYKHLRAFLYNGGYLYRNGGNFFYADLVSDNLRAIQLYEKIFK